MANVDGVLRAAAARLPHEGSRREFLRLAGALGGMVALAACDDDDELTGGAGGGGTLVLNFAQPIDVLRYAYALEALEADFYTRVVANSAFATAFASAAERQLLTDIRDHEVAHRQFLAAAIPALGGTVPTLATQYPTSVNFGDRASVLGTARTFEDLGVAAYNGAGRYLTATPALPLLTVAGKIVSVEARHASAIRDLLAPNTASFANVGDLAGLGASETNGLDAKLSPTQVIAAAQPFVTTPITVTGLAA